MEKDDTRKELYAEIEKTLLHDGTLLNEKELCILTDDVISAIVAAPFDRAKENILALNAYQPGKPIVEVRVPHIGTFAVLKNVVTDFSKMKINPKDLHNRRQRTRYHKLAAKTKLLNSEAGFNAVDYDTNAFEIAKSLYDKKEL